MLALLTGYILGVVLRRGEPTSASPALPETTAELAVGLLPELAVFAVVMGLACWIGRPSRRDLFTERAPGILNWILGFCWSWGLRFGLGALVGVVAVVIEALKKNPTAGGLEAFRPKVENLVDLRALQNPWYLLTICTVVSFVLAGLREELWRAGMIGAAASLMPGAWSDKARQFLAVALAALVFGAAHHVQGPPGMVLAGILGLLLGGIMVLRKSLWEAVIAHGFFDATSFLLLRVFSDRDLLERILIRAGLSAGMIKEFLDQLSPYFRK
jgi:membrane protease YdiL (CAAX protease family)